MNTRTLKAGCFVDATKEELSKWHSIIGYGDDIGLYLSPTKNWEAILLTGEYWTRYFRFQKTELLK
ncbi:MAG: hypothetical protein KDK37_18440, partial [Leptospiraceae bacterium]|nr:hypothetical protein [Leptospiraceae bacterium]